MKYSLRRISALLVAVLMLLSAFSGALADTEYSNIMQIDAWGSGSSTVDHIDIACTGLNARVYVNDAWRDVTFSFTKQEVDNGTVKVDITSSSSAGFSITGTTTSSGSTTGAQVRFKGSFPVGTKDSPVNYNITFRKTLTVDGVSVPVVLSASYNYWTSANDCPGLEGKKTQWQSGAVISGSGIDLELGEGSAEYGTFHITKKVTGLELTDDNAVFHFLLENKGDGSKIYVDCPVSKEDGVGSVTVTLVPFGTYEIIELDSEVEGYWLNLSIPSTKLVLDSVNPVRDIVVTNDYLSKYVSVAVRKEWEDLNKKDGKRPDSVTVELLADGVKTGKELTLTAENNWQGSFTGLSRRPNDDDTEPDIVYTIVEKDVPNYKSNITGSAAEGFVVTNTEQVTISGSKTWNDDGNRDNVRPEKIIINLLVDGEVIDSKIVTAEDGWKWSFTGDKYDADGNEINYTIEEEDVENYKGVVDGYNVTNTHEIETIEKISVSKEWEDAGNQDGKRPASVTVELVANNQPTNKTLTLNAENNWKGSFTNLPKNENGKPIAYTIAELSVPDYDTNITGSVENGFVVTNTHVPEKIAEIAGSKTWDDNDDQDRKRPKEITINLLADGTKVDSKTVSAEDGWKWSFTNLDKYAGGKEIVYTITEEEVRGYTTVVTGYDVKNSYTPGKVNVNVVKAWDDNNNQDGKRPQEVVVKLYADNVDTGKTVVLNSDNKWQASFTGLDEYKAGTKIVYTVAEAQVADGYTADVEESNGGYTIINSHIPEKIKEISGSKTWVDNDNEDRKRPESITIRLFADGIEKDSVVVTAENGWKWSFTDLDKYAQGKEIVYTIEEDEVENYIAKVDGFNVTNTYVPETIDEIVGSKTWDDNGNQDGKRPESITIRLLANGNEVAVQKVKADDAGVWSWSFTDLPKYANGEEIVYTITEDEVPYYISEVNGFDVTNTHEIETIDEIAGSKTWKDDDNSGKTRPESITIRLLANGKEYAAQEVKPDDNGNWTWSFTDLPKYESGKEIVYTIKEDRVKGYTAKVDGFNVTNTLDDDEVPKTGDARSDLQRTMLYLGMAFLLLGVACIAASARKRQNNR